MKFVASICSYTDEWNKWLLGEEGEFVDLISKAKIFESEEQALEFAEDYRPLGFRACAIRLCDL